MASIALGQMRRRPAAFAGLAVALLLAVAVLTLFGSLVAADATAPPAAGGRAADHGPGLMVIAGVFGEIAVLVAFFVVVNTLGFALRRQHRELALLRTIAATPRQARRMVRGQLVATTLLVAPPGWAVGWAAARRFLAALQRRGLAAPEVRVPGAPVVTVVAPVTLAVVLVVGLVAAAVAARRITRIAPAAALAASSTEHARTGAIRLVAGAGVLVGGGLLLRLAATRPLEEADKAGQATLLGALVLLVAVALLGPLVARVLAAVLGAPVRALAPGTGWLADANLRGYARRLSSAVVPVALLVGLSGTMSIMTSTAQHAAAAATNGATSATDIWLRQAELALLACFAAVSTVNTLVAVTAERRREFALLRLVGATRTQLTRMLTVEAVLTTVVGVLLGAAVTAAATGAFSVAVTGSPLPYVSSAACAWIGAAAATLTVPAILVTGLRALRGPATEGAAGRD
ncbi:ABC transporter permease [Streptomyces sp. NBC_01268]|uniref:ABC transporter permease n=1 Tax=Streptomyces sp. NBC_01268 TaxID=2903806 RepID=UPI002E318DB9|nr:ABC transporter permease [Streptomyces sp. NBC_01268]